MSSLDEERARLARAEERRSRMIIRKTHLGETDVDIDPIRGAAAISLAAQLSRYSWSLSGGAMPNYARSDIPIRCVPWTHE